MSVTLPPPLDRLIAAINGGDIAAFLALFPADGMVEDWGRRFAGHPAIRKWSDKELIGAKGTLTVTKASRKGDEISFTGDWKSNFYSGVGRFILRIDGDRIREMRILAD